MEKKRIFAWIGIILMVGMYVATFIFALGKSPFFQTMFLASVAATIIVPVLLYGIFMMTGVLKPKKSDVIDSIIFDVGYVLADFPLRDYARKAGVSEDDRTLNFFIAAQDRNYESFRANLVYYLHILNDGQQKLAQEYNRMVEEKKDSILPDKPAAPSKIMS